MLNFLKNVIFGISITYKTTVLGRVLYILWTTHTIQKMIIKKYQITPKVGQLVDPLNFRYLLPKSTECIQYGKKTTKDRFSRVIDYMKQ